MVKKCEDKKPRADESVRSCRKKLANPVKLDIAKMDLLRERRTSCAPSFKRIFIEVNYPDIFNQPIDERH